MESYLSEPLNVTNLDEMGGIDTWSALEAFVLAIFCVACFLTNMLEIPILFMIFVFVALAA